MQEVKKLRIAGWIWYFKDGIKPDPAKRGKWMCFYKDKENAETLCKMAVEQGVVSEAKYSKRKIGFKGLICFYLHSDDIEGHKRVLKYFMDYNMIKKNLKGRYKNISFKLDGQTGGREYVKKLKGTIKLSDFVDIDTGEWIER